MSVEPQAGEPARKFTRADTRAPHSPDGPWELIGPSDCPLFWRRTIFAGRLGKLTFHRFVANARDKDCHDHPASFVSFILRGGYDDVQPDGTTDEVRAPTVRFRRAAHAHVTNVGPRGATTVVLMFRKSRDWGFWRDGSWFQWRHYEQLFGLNWRCDE